MGKRTSILRGLLCLAVLAALMAAGCNVTSPPPNTPATQDTTTPSDTPTHENIPTPNSTLPPTNTPAAIVARGTEQVITERVLPSPYYCPTIIRAPIAWKLSTGKSVRVAVTRNHNEDLTLVNMIAPDASVEALEVDKDLRVGGKALVDLLKLRGISILAIVEPGDFAAKALHDSVVALTDAGLAVFVNGNLSDRPEELALVNDLEASGAITVGALDMNGRARGSDLNERRISLFAPYGAEFDRGAVLTAAGVGALVLGTTYSITPAMLKEQLVSTADEMYQASSISTGEWSPRAVTVDPGTGDYSPAGSAFRFRRVNAARAVGVKLTELWPVNALNAPAAWKTATGRGVTVAVLDQGFHVDNLAFQGHLVDKAAFFPGQGFSGQQNFHGTSMAKIVLAIAPDVSLVFLHHGNSNQVDAMAKAYAEAIDYAIAHGVRVITSSAAPWPNTPEVHAAIDRAIEAGLVVVWFHYSGHNTTVIRPGHFCDRSWEVGAFDRFFDDDKPSDLEGGLSLTAPQVAAIATLILQNEPKLSPVEVKKRILETATILPDGNSIADAAAAVENRPSGRQLAFSGIAPVAHGHCSLAYQSPGAPERTVVEVEEQGQSWPVAIWPRRDIALYHWSSSATGSSIGSLRLEVYRHGTCLLRARLLSDRLASGESPARVVLYPEGWFEYALVTLGEGQVPPLRVEVNGDRVRLSWESTEGVPMESRDQTGRTGPSGYRLYRLEIEAQRLPDLVAPVY